MKKILCFIAMGLIASIVCYRNYTQQITLDNLTISAAVELDILNVKTKEGSPTDSLVLQMTNQLVGTKVLKYKTFDYRYNDNIDGENTYIQVLLSKVGEYNNEYQTARSGNDLDFDNSWEQRLRRLGNNDVAPWYQEILEAK